MKAHILQVNVATSESIRDANGREFTSAVRKRPVANRIAVTEGGLDGDGCTHHSHGGPMMRIHAFASEHYAWFEERAGRPITRPAFGENLTLAGCTEDDTRIGDVVRAGTALLQVTQPTVRCNTPGRGAGLPDLLAWSEERMATGWYLRVLEPGEVGPGDAYEIVTPGSADLTLARLTHVFLREVGDAAKVHALAADPRITEEWRGSLTRRATRHAAEAGRETQQPRLPF